MHSRRIVIGTAVVGAAAALIATASPAFAYPGYKLTSGNTSSVNATNGSIGYTALQSGNLQLTASSGANLVCSTSTNSGATGSVNRGTYASPTVNVGTVGTTKFGTGTYSGGVVSPGSAPCLASSQLVAVQQTGTWVISVTGASSPTSANPALNQVTPGKLSNIKATVEVGSNGQQACVFDVGGSASSYTGAPTAGTVNGSYKNTSGKGTLTVTPNTGDLHVFNTRNPAGTSLPNGCASGTIKNGNTLSYNGAYTISAVSPATDAIWLTS